MITYFDTSVIMGLLHADQEIYEASVAVFAKSSRSGRVVTTTLHAYAELYTNLTQKGGGRPGMPPEDVAVVRTEQVGRIFEMIELTKTDYEAAVIRCGKLGFTSGVIYDALHLQAAIKVGADVLYTNNLKDFNRLITKDDKIVVKGVR
ncbi:MAG: putative nucleic acid-binding protein [Neolewinella sp.]|jgi:predicted nucleic acid-binding protein